MLTWLPDRPTQWAEAVTFIMGLSLVDKM